MMISSGSMLLRSSLSISSSSSSSCCYRTTAATKASSVFPSSQRRTEIKLDGRSLFMMPDGSKTGFPSQKSNAEDLLKNSHRILRPCSSSLPTPIVAPIDLRKQYFSSMKMFTKFQSKEAGEEEYGTSSGGAKLSRGDRSLTNLLLLVAALIAAYQVLSDAEEMKDLPTQKAVIEPQAQKADTNAIDPFSNTTPLNAYEVAKIIFGAFYLLPFRILFTVPIFMFAYLLARLSILGLSDSELSAKPLPKWRRALLKPISFLARLMLFIFGVYKIRRHGKPASAAIAPIVVSNHIAFLDAIVYTADFLPTFVAKHETLNWPLVGSFVRAMQCILVNRLSEDSRKQAVSEINRRTADHHFPQLLVFPEGTCTNGSALISFRLGAFNPGVPVQPVVIRYPHKNFNPAMVGAANMPLLFLRMGIQFANNVEVHYLEPYVPSAEERANPTLFAQNVRDKMSRALGVPQTSHTFEDGLRSKKEKQHKSESATPAAPSTLLKV